MVSVLLLVAVTLLYAGYNLFIKLSGGYVPASATTTVTATICLQLAALSTSILFLVMLAARGGQVFALSSGAYLWAVVAGICIGGAEIGYLYLFGGIGMSKPMPANIAIPVIVSGTIVISLLFAYVVLNEPIALNQWLGCAMVLLGIGLLFANGTK